MSRPAWPAAAAAASVAVVLSLAACGSDDFGTLGTRLPIDVRQDSVAVADTLVGTLQELRVVPEVSQPYASREILYLGTDARNGLRATPLLRFDFTDLPDSIDIFQYRWLNVALQMKMLAKDQGRAVRTLAVYALADTFAAAMADSQLSSVLGDSLELASGLLGSANFQVPLDSALVASWIQAGRHTGIALVDRTAAPDTNIVGLAGRQFTHYSLLALEDPSETVIAEIGFELDDPNLRPALKFVNFPVLEDLTHFTGPAPAADLELASHLPARTWLRFDLSAIDPTATINAASLVLPVDTLRTFGNGVVTLAAYRCTADEAATGDLGLLEQVLDSPASLDLVHPPRVVLNVTEFVQRKVNGVLREGDGLLVALDSEILELHRLPLYGSQAVDVALRPRIELRVTPPAEYEE